MNEQPVAINNPQQPPGQNNGQSSGNSRNRANNNNNRSNRAEERARQRRRLPARLPAWFHRYNNYDLYGYREPPLSIFDADISDLSSNADSEKRRAKYDDWDCDCTSDVSDCECEVPWEEKTEDEDESYGYDEEALEYAEARRKRNERKRQLRDQAWEQEAYDMDDEELKLSYEETQEDLVEEIEEAIAAISKAAGTSEAREVSNKTLRSCEYRLVPAENLNYHREHLVKTMYKSRLGLQGCGFSEYRKLNGSKVLMLEGTLTINGMSMAAEHPQETSFIGPDWAGRMRFPTKGDRPDVWVRFHNRDFIEVNVHVHIFAETIHALDEQHGGPCLDERGQKPPLASMYRGPGGYIRFYGMRCTPARDWSEAVEQKRLYVEPEPPSPQSPKESWFEMNHRMGAYYDSRYSEYF
ncbi:hypothetical protein CPLU01_07594 [Colletotrichum plurivorum]|uniref:Uncharacterized protein n=1 Tax=Colletotrichum plurivorum TaxID=2175906 RepID=A0A8H6KEH3_9PEZI|nr:hypothetical protein CPLU01_07594 [Colletotrichum plurivorum]